MMVGVYVPGRLSRRGWNTRTVLAEREMSTLLSLTWLGPHGHFHGTLCSPCKVLGRE